jgi:hypothetical protein
LGRSHWKWPILWQRWQLMPDVRLVEMVDKEGFAALAPYNTKALLVSVVRGAVVEGTDDVEGGCEAEGIVVLDGVVDVERA